MAAAELANLAPDYVRGIAPYSPGKPIEEVARELSMDPAGIIKLASNENPRGPSAKVIVAIAAAAGEISRYPDGSGFALRTALSARFGVEPGQIVLGNGSNDVLELVSQAFLRPGDDAIYSQHGFAVYPLAIQARGAHGIEVPARDFGHDLAAMLAAITPKTRLIFVANPNNPTGTWIEPAEVERFVASVPADVLVVLDEAYNEYLEPSRRVDTLAWIARYPNLIVARTFSKAYGLAALRVGYGVMDAVVAAMLNRVRQPFNVNALAQAAALAAIADTAYVDESRALNRKGLAQIAQALERLGRRYLPSQANFILIHVGDAAEINRALLKDGVIVRPVANYGLPEWLRVTVGLPSENERFIDALARALPP